MKIYQTLKRAIPLSVRVRLGKGLNKVIPSRIAQKARQHAAQLKAERECLELAPQLFGEEARQFEGRLEVLAHAVEVARGQGEGLWLEFGVHRAESLNMIAARTEATVFGFDSFRGLPEDWFVGEEHTAQAGTFALSPPPTVRENARLVVGLFQETLPEFFRDHPEPVTLAHIDCDLYASTRYVLGQLNVQPGAILVFDEYYYYPNWREGEYKAFQEFLREGEREVECITYATKAWNAAFRVLR